MRRKGFEPPTYWFVASYSIQLSYRRMFSKRICVPSTMNIIAQWYPFVKGYFCFFRIRQKLALSSCDFVWIAMP